MASEVIISNKDTFQSKLKTLVQGGFDNLQVSDLDF